MPMSTIRTFIAIEIDPAVRQAIRQLQENAENPAVKISWTRPGNIHLTLKFLGEVPEKRVEEIGLELKRIAESQDSFHVGVRGVGVFPGSSRARVFWVGLADPGNRLVTLAGRVDAAMHGLGFKREKRAFTPHLTVGRAKVPPPRAFVEAFLKTPFDAGEQSVAEIVLMKSELHPRGAIYTPLVRCALK